MDSCIRCGGIGTYMDHFGDTSRCHCTTPCEQCVWHSSDRNLCGNGRSQHHMKAPHIHGDESACMYYQEKSMDTHGSGFSPESYESKELCSQCVLHLNDIARLTAERDSASKLWEKGYRLLCNVFDRDDGPDLDAYLDEHVTAPSLSCIASDRQSLVRERDAAIEARDLWCAQCNMMSEEHATALSYSAQRDINIRTMTADRDSARAAAKQAGEVMERVRTTGDTRGEAYDQIAAAIARCKEVL